MLGYFPYVFEVLVVWSFSFRLLPFVLAFALGGLVFEFCVFTVGWRRWVDYYDDDYRNIIIVCLRSLRLSTD